MSETLIARSLLDFLVFDWLGAAELTARPIFAGHDRMEFEAVLDVYEGLARNDFAPHNALNDVAEPRFDNGSVVLNPQIGAALAKFVAAGLLAARMPEAIGGLGLPAVVERAGLAYLMAANISTCAYMFLTIANADLLIHHASEQQIERYVRPMLEGRFFGTMCLSEPHAGSGLADIRTKAILQPDGSYRLFGNKMWISGAEHDLSENIVHLVLAKIVGPDDVLPAGVQGISLFIVPRFLLSANGAQRERNDIALAGVNHKMGYRGTVNCALNFGEGHFMPGGRGGAVAELVGEPGSGLAHMFSMMNEARIGVGLGAAALASAGYLHSLEYARTRLQGRTPAMRDPTAPPVPIIRHADVRRMLLAQKVYAEGGLALVLYAARLSDEAQSAPSADARQEAAALLEVLTPVVKSWPSEWGPVANDLAIQVLGGAGYTRDHPVEQYYRDNRLNPIHEGTLGIQGIDLLGRRVKLGGAGMSALDARIGVTLHAIAQNDSLAAHGRGLERRWKRLRSVTESLHQLSDRTLMLANATPYLQAFGHLVVAWLWLDQAHAATARRGLDAAVVRGKYAACDYMAAWELPRVDAWLGVLDPIDRTPLDMQDAWF